MGKELIASIWIPLIVTGFTLHLPFVEVQVPSYRASGRMAEPRCPISVRKTVEAFDGGMGKGAFSRYKKAYFVTSEKIATVHAPPGVQIPCLPLRKASV